MKLRELRVCAREGGEDAKQKQRADVERDTLLPAAVSWQEGRNPVHYCTPTCN